MPKVSVIIPVWNSENYIERCSRSLFEQTLDDIEFIFINDHTQDSSIDKLLDVINEYPQRKEQVQILHLPSNMGQARVRKLGILNASGDYVINCDSDDWVDLNTYKLLYDYAVDNDIDILFHNYYITDGVNNTYIENESDFNNCSNVIKDILSGKFKGSLCLTLIRRSLFANSSFIFPRHNMTEDSTALVQLLSCFPKIGHLSDPLYYYLQNNNSITKLMTEKQCKSRFKDCVGNTQLLEAFFQQNNIMEYKDEMVLKRIDSMNQLLPCINSPGVLRMWKDAFPNMLATVYKANIPMRVKVKFMAIYGGIYPLYHKLKGYKFAE